MDENHRSRPPVETFMLVLCMACPGVLLGTFFRLNDLTGGRFSGWMTPHVVIPLFVLTLVGCCWFAGWILESGIEESRRVHESFETGLLLLMFQLLLAPVVAFVGSFLFHRFF
jgi:hypothetical protein